MRRVIKNVKNLWEISRGRKYTKLFLNGLLFRVWDNVDIDFVLKTSNILQQIKYFQINLID